MSQHDMSIRNTVIIHPDCRESFLGGTSEGIMSLYGIRLAGISEFRTAYRIGRKDEPFHVVFATLAGRGSLRVPGRVFTIEGGDVFVVPAHTPHEYSLDSPSWSACWFHLEPVLSWSDIGQFRVDHGEPEVAARLWNLMEDCLSEARSVDALANRALAALAGLIAVRLERLIRPQVGLDPTMHNIVEAWDRAAKSPGRQWPISVLAEGAGRSERQFHRDTLKLFGETPGDRLARLRIDRAAEYLRSTDYSLATIAELVGFRNPYSLSNAYKRLRGRRPSEDRAPR
jgi:AraC-like DNA-binding protein